jgi:signal transduction histidine kinase
MPTAVRRLGAIASPANRERLLWAVRVRWLTIAGFSLLAGVAWQVGLLAGLGPCAVAGVGAALVNAGNHWCVARWRAVRAVTALAIPADVALITYLIVATGGLGSPFVMLYVVQVVATAMLVDLWIAGLVAVTSAGGLTAALWLGRAASTAPPNSPLQQAVWSLFLLYCLGLLTFVGGYIADRLRRSEGSLRDTARRLRATEAQLVQSEKLRALGEFVAGIAHELNNPIGIVVAAIDPLRAALAAFDGYCETCTGIVVEPAARCELAKQSAALRLDWHRGEWPSLLDDCAEGAQRSAEIVAALGAFARGGADELPSLVDLRQRMERTLVLLRHRLGGVRVLRDYDAVPPLRCRAAQLDQVWMNLLVNACDAVGAAGTIRVAMQVVGAPRGALHSGPHVQVTIADDGPGMTPDICARVFEPFFTTKAEGSGTGLGLSVSYGIVERHDGLIDVESAPGRGSRFRVALPLGERIEA